jgi:membrane associated rhomboid family serine protease
MNSQSYAINRRHVLTTIAACLLVLLIAIVVALTPTLALGWRVFASILIMPVIFVLVKAVWLILSKAPGLVLTSTGIEVPNAFFGQIPWISVTRIERNSVKYNEFLKLTLEPSVAPNIAWRGLAQKLRPRVLNISISQLKALPDDIVAATVSAWHRGHAAALSAGTSVTPSAIEPPPATLAAGRPFATIALIALFIAVYFCELYFAVDHSSKFEPSVQTLAYLGGDLGIRVKANGEYWRMFTAPLLHAGLLHIFMNCFVLYLTGTILELIVGWKWMFGLFAITALGGEVASLFFLEPNIVGVGASGGGMGILAALFAMANRLPADEADVMRTRALQFLIPSLLPIFLVSEIQVNYFAHAGGAIVGLALGFALLKLWRRDAAKPPFANAMAITALGFFAVAVYAIYPIIKLYEN